MAGTDPRLFHGWLTEQDCRVEDFRAVVEQLTDATDYPLAESVEQNVLIYGDRLRGRLGQPEPRRQAEAELARALLEGPGIVVLKGAFEDLSVIDRASAAFTEMIAEQKAGGLTAGDHFAAPGANDRVWGALDKLAVRAPEVFAEYYANDLIAVISHAWLGPNYQITSQINVVNPGGRAQVAHRDYHLGFMSGASAGQYPAHIQRLSPMLTLQGAVAHCDMPIETGPTMYLPHSQKYEPGYLAFHRPEFTAYFDRSYVQLPLAKGDAAFFNPALFHGAGTNRSSDVRRMANLLQVSSAFGRAMETVDRHAMSVAVFGALSRMKEAGAGEQALRNVVAACAEGYAFPTNLDRDQPIDGLVPQTQAELLWEAVEQEWPVARLLQQFQALAERHESAVRG